MTPDQRPGPSRGRRMAAAAPAKPSRVSIVLAVLLPLLTLGAIAFVDGTPAPGRAGVPPQDTELTSLQVVCPASIETGDLRVSSARASGEVSVRLGDDTSDLDLTSDATSVLTGRDGAVVVDGRGDLAPGLVATRLDDESAAASVCGPPQPEYWFTGAGSASIHSSVLELVNSDSGPAVADIEIRSQRGTLSIDSLRGVTVAGGTSTAIDLASTAPNRHELSVHVTVNRGRLGASLLDTIDDDGRSTDWLAPQAAPATNNVLLGLTDGFGSRQLVVSNSTDDQARVQLKVIGSDSTFAPIGFKEISVPPQATVVTDVTEIVRTAMAKEESGLLVTSTVPTSVGLRSLTGSPRDLSHAVTAQAVRESATLLPAGKATLVMTAPQESGTVSVTSYDADGAELSTERLAVKRLTSASLELPQKTSLVVVEAEGVPLPGAVRVVDQDGTVVLPLNELVLSALVPSVTAGNPSVVNGVTSSQSSS
ncbi:conserved exported hypothetical protein [metagenome]|uniref:Secreted protein n=1 Tax=metagenome TaxID=256318 RepID=A0A2P2CBR1_9ZZZZ